MKIINSFVLASALLIFVGTGTTRSQTAAFTYQGQLNDNGSPANGTYDLRFILYDAHTGGSQQGSILTIGDVIVTNGVFTVALDFGPGTLPGEERWIEIAVRPGASAGGYTLLQPRQHVTAAPYAIHAANAELATSASTLSGTISAANVPPGTINSTMLALGSVTANALATGAVSSSALADGSVTSDKLLRSTNLALSITFTNPNPAELDRFGSAISAVGTDKIIISAAGNQPPGSAYLFSINSTLLRTFTNPSPTGDRFGNSVAGLGSDKVIIAAFENDLGATNAGVVYVFNIDGTLLKTISNPAPAVNDLFGECVASIGSDKVLISAIGKDIGDQNVGIAYLFNADGFLLATFANPTPAANDFFGTSLASLGSDKVIIGADSDDTGNNNAGAVYLFNTNGTHLLTITNPTPESSDSFGYAVSALGLDHIAVGAYSDNTIGNNRGAVYVFNTNGVLVRTITHSGNELGFGAFVQSFGPDKLLIGIEPDFLAATGPGAAYLFGIDGSFIQKFSNPSGVTQDDFGSTMAAVGSSVVVCDPERSAGVDSVGIAYLFSPTSYAVGVISEGVVPESITVTHLANDSVTAEKIAGVLYQSQIPNLSASKITSGQLSDFLIPSSIARLNSIQTFTATPHFNPTSGGSPFTVGNSTRVSNLNADLLDGLTSSQFSLSSHQHDSVYWKQNGNSGTTDGTDFIGTTDNQALEFKVNGTRALRLEPTSSNATVNVIGGSPSNFVSAKAVGVVIGGGGSGFSSYSNSVFASHAVIAGGAANSVNADSDFAVIAGGYFNQIGTNSGKSTIGGGFGNTIIPNSEGAAISGGQGNKVMTNSQFSVISGGLANYVQESSYSIIGGGFDNRIVGASKSAIFSGEENRIERDSNYGTINGGWLNSIGTNSDYASIGGGSHNFILRNSRYATIPGGVDNVATNYAFAAGRWAQAIHTGAFVWADSQSAAFSSSGANQFLIRAQGGVGINTSDPSGALEVAVASGKSLQFRHDSGLVPGINVATSGGNGGIMRFRNAMEVWPSDDLTRSAKIDLRSTNGAATIVLSGQSGNISCVTLNQTSDRNVKENFEPIDAAKVLEKVAALPISEWSFKMDSSARHIGPMAQDFKESFGLGTDDKSIATVDADGVALAAIQGLNQKMEAKEKELAAMKERLEKLERLIVENNGGVK